MMMMEMFPNVTKGRKKKRKKKNEKISTVSMEADRLTPPVAFDTFSCCSFSSFFLCFSIVPYQCLFLLLVDVQCITVLLPSAALLPLDERFPFLSLFMLLSQSTRKQFPFSSFQASFDAHTLAHSLPNVFSFRLMQVFYVYIVVVRISSGLF